MDRFIAWFTDKFLEWQRLSGKRKTVAEFSEYLGIPRSILSHYMNGRNIPAGENVDKIAAAFGPEIYDILGLARPDPYLDEIRTAYDKVIKEKRDHFVVTVKELAELQEKIEMDDLNKITYVVRAGSQSGRVVEVIRERSDYAKLKEMFNNLTEEEKQEFIKDIQGSKTDG